MFHTPTKAQIKKVLEKDGGNALAMLSTLFKFPLKRTFYKVHDDNGALVLDLRGWGYLTGKGHAALGLDEQTAMDAQDRFGDEIVTLLNKLNELA